MIRTKYLLKKESGIYKIQSITNHKIYVGSAVNVNKRILSHHLTELKRNKHYNSYLQRHTNKYEMDHLKQEMAVNVAKVMQQIGSIRYEIDTDFPSGNVKITATTYVPEKL